MLFVESRDGREMGPDGRLGFMIPGLVPSFAQLPKEVTQEAECIIFRVARGDLPVNRIGTYQFKGHICGTYDGETVTVQADPLLGEVRVRPEAYLAAVALLNDIMLGRMRPWNPSLQEGPLPPASNDPSPAPANPATVANLGARAVAGIPEGYRGTVDPPVSGDSGRLRGC